jgi:hypothetical protein
VDTKNYKYKGNRSKGNKDDRPCIRLRIHLHWPRGVCPSWVDPLYVRGTKETSPSSTPVSVGRFSLVLCPNGV